MSLAQNVLWKIYVGIKWETWWWSACIGRAIFQIYCGHQVMGCRKKLVIWWKGNMLFHMSKLNWRREEWALVWSVGLDCRTQYSNKRSPGCALLDRLLYINGKTIYDIPTATCPLKGVSVVYCIMRDFSRNYWRSNWLVTHSAVLNLGFIQNLMVCQHLALNSCN